MLWPSQNKQTLAKRLFCDGQINFILEFQSLVASNPKGMQRKKVGPQLNKYKNLGEKIYD